MGDHLKIDLDMLRDTARSLGMIEEVLRRAEADARNERGVLGSGELADAMDDFVSNWKIHRKRLIESIDKHQQAAHDSADAYEDTDRELAKALEGEGSSSPSGGRGAPR